METQQKDLIADFQRQSLKLSVVMPAYNEAGVIFESVLETARMLDGIDYEIIVVDDGSTDRTYAEAQRAAQVVNSRNGKRQGQVKALRYEPNQGKGHALKYGYAQATGDLVAFLDADLDLHPCQLWSLWRIMQQTGADVVIGSKRHPESKLHYPWQRKIISWCYFALVNLLFGLPLHDMQTGIKLFRREVLEQVLPRMQVQRFAHDLELLVGAHRFGYRIAEAPVTLTFRGGKLRSLSLARACLDVGLDTLRIFYWASAWKWFSPGFGTRLWILGLLAGVSAFSFGLAGFLSRAGLPQSLGEVANYIFLKFLDERVRDGLLVVGGLLIAVIAALQLNKAVLAAFARQDRGDLAGIAQAHCLKRNAPAAEARALPARNLRRSPRGETPP